MHRVAHMIVFESAAALVAGGHLSALDLDLVEFAETASCLSVGRASLKNTSSGDILFLRLPFHVLPE